MSSKKIGPRVRTIRRRKTDESAELTAPLPTSGGPYAAPPAAAAAPAEPTPASKPEPAPRVRLDSKALEAEIAELGSDAMAQLMAEAAPVDPEPGTQVEGTVARVATHGVFVDIGAKSEAVMDRSDFEDPDAVTVGDKVKAYVLSADGRGIKLARQLSGAGAREMLAEAHASGIPVQGTVTSRNPGGFSVKIAGSSAFCPVSQIARIPVEDLDSYLGLTLNFKIIEFKGRDLVVSHRAIEEVAAAEAAAEAWTTLKNGDERDGVVSGVQDFGIFVDIGGIQGLVHKTELGWDDGTEPPAKGTKVKVKIVSIDPDKQRLSLTMKMPGMGPWARVGTEFVEGGSYEGTVTRLTDFGAFIQLAAGLEGLAHISELSEHHVDHPRSIVKKGQQVKVRILEIDRERGRIGLSMKPGAEGGWRKSATQAAEQGTSMGTLGDIFGDMLGGLKLK
jgi:small subunit ribosomal protein S1